LIGLSDTTAANSVLAINIPYMVWNSDNKKILTLFPSQKYRKKIVLHDTCRITELQSENVCYAT